ncbi:putative deoxynucleotidyltransferase terminal-interacting protein 2 [Apostichopus japonicus]|uniref:Putative deoxynucleotidyltransferase terminal-interacting protein 2 n=1 Tax=Stichopus japonicus TaxID=307972 RepID=A0A2G8JUD3_STIJA|nr:putative deoxynucleotidyltransferase terminal-interacting protein 2 [Apostichopus japonicus]
MKTRASMRKKQQFEKVDKKNQTSKKNEEEEGDKLSDYSSDSEIDRLVTFAVKHINNTRLNETEKTSEEQEGGWTEDFLPLDSLEKQKSSNSTSQEKVKSSSILRVANVVKENIIPQGLDSGYDLEPDKEPTPQESEEKIDDIRQMLAKSSQDKLLEKSVLTPDLEKLHNIPPYKNSKRSEKKERKKIRDSKAGDGWFNMKAVEMTPELENDLKTLQMRSVLDPKRFYRKNDMKTLPKFVQVGTVMDSSVDFYHARVSKKERRQTIVEELLADAETRRYNKRKYMELQIHRSSSKRRRKMMKHLN